MEYFCETENEIPLFGEYDVLVLGGGPAGVSAAVSAARAGAKTAIVERYGYLGGQATGGLVILLVGLTDGKEIIIKGFCEETINRLASADSTKQIGNHVLFDAESMKYLFDCMIEENQITPFYHSFVSEVIMDGNKVTGAVIDGKSGRRIIKAKCFVDATGDADLAKYCNAPFDQEPSENILPTTLGFRVGGIEFEKVNKFTSENRDFYKNLLTKLGVSTKIGGWLPTLNKNEAWFNVSHIDNIDITDSDELTRAEILGRKQIQKIMKTFKEHIPGFEDAYLIDTAAQIGGRESRRIKGLYRFTKEDVTSSFADTIARAPDYTRSGKGSVQIPYRCLLSEKVENVIFAGRCISVEHNLIDMFREIPCCMATGQAAGVAASIASKHFEPLYNIDVECIQDVLLSQGASLVTAAMNKDELILT